MTGSQNKRVFDQSENIGQSGILDSNFNLSKAADIFLLFGGMLQLPLFTSFHSLFRPC